jgi:pimeloyl-ACP methyl ester carboxylesterase
MKRFGYAVSFLLVILMLTSCLRSKPASTPIPVKFFSSGNDKTKALVLFLPGRGDSIDAFEQAGFISALQQSTRPLDALVVDAHMGYYMDGSLPRRIHDDILLPYQQKGYSHFIIVGISIGGYGAVWTRHEYENLISGMVLLAPYLGPDTLADDIRATGDLHAWRSKLDYPIDFDDLPWIWLDDMNKDGYPKSGNMLLGFGNRDRLRNSAELLATMLEDSAVFRISGAHDWETWKTIWSDITQSRQWAAIDDSNNGVL